MGIAQIAITPPPRTQTGTLGHFFSGAILPFFTIFTIFYPFYHFFTIFSLNKCPKPSGQGFRPPQNQANAHLNLENSSLKKCPKPSGQGFRPPPPNGQCPNGGGDKLKGASLTSIGAEGDEGWESIAVCQVRRVKASSWNLEIYKKTLIVQKISMKYILREAIIREKKDIL